MKTLVLILQLCALAAMAQRHPGYNLISIRPGSFQPKVTGMDFLSDGRMIMTTSDLKNGQNSYNDAAIVYTLSGTEGNSSSNVQVQTYATGLRDAMGVTVVNDNVYVVQRDALMRFTDNNGDGVSDGQTNLLTGWVQGDRMWSYGPEHVNGNLFFTISVNHSNTGGYGDNSAHQYRGCALRLTVGGGNATIYAGGLRQPNGITSNSAGEVFVTDNQGQYLPHNKFIHLQQGAFYGHDDTPFQPGNNLFPQDPPAVWLVQQSIANSPSQPDFITQGRFASQFLVGDVTAGGLRRIFIEKVNGEYQGAVFDWGNGLEVGIEKVKESSDGSIFVGGLGNGSNGSSGAWGWGGATYGFQKLVENSNSVVEILAIRSVANGFEIEFTEPIGNNGSNASSYSLERWGVAPAAGYGAGARENQRNVSVQAVSVSSDRRRATLTVNDLQHSGPMPSTIFHFTLSVTSQGNQSLWRNQGWYTLNNVGPADVLGCMDQGYQEYNPQADYDDGIQCQTPAVSLKPELASFSWMDMSVQMSSQEVLLHAPYFFKYSMDVINVQGKKIAEFSGSEPQTFHLDRSSLPLGLYMLQIRTGNKQHIQRLSVY